MTFDSNRQNLCVKYVDRMLQLLACPENWCKERMHITRYNPRTESYCIVGAFYCAADNKEDFIPSDIGAEVYNRICSMVDIERFRGLWYFNDFSGTTYEDVISLLKKTRQSFIEEAINAV